MMTDPGRREPRVFSHSFDDVESNPLVPMRAGKLTDDKLSRRLAVARIHRFGILQHSESSGLNSEAGSTRRARASSPSPSCNLRPPPAKKAHILGYSPTIHVADLPTFPRGEFSGTPDACGSPASWDCGKNKKEILGRMPGLWVPLTWYLGEGGDSHRKSKDRRATQARRIAEIGNGSFLAEELAQTARRCCLLVIAQAGSPKSKYPTLQRGFGPR